MASLPAVDLEHFEVEIDGERYRLDELPADGSAVVLAQKKYFLGTIDLKMFVEGLSSIGSLLRVAYYSTTAAGFRCTNLRIEIERIGFDIAKLCNKCEITVLNFARASSNVLNDLQATYAYLLENEENLAVLTLADVSETAKKMEQASLELYQEIEKQAESVVSAKVESIKTQATEAERIQQLRKERVDLEEKQRHQTMLIDEKLKLEREAKADRLFYEAEEDKEISDIGNPFKHLFNSLASIFGVEMFDEEAPVIKAAEWKEKRKAALQLEEQYRQQYYEANREKCEFAGQISECHSQEDFAKVAESALQLTLGALKELSLLMLQVAKFWKQMGDHCNSLADGKMLKHVKEIMKFPEEKRQKQWTSKGFKMRAVRVDAEWVALQSVCSKYIEDIKDTQKKLYENIKQNPTCEQACLEIKPLAEAFQRELKQVQIGIMDKTAEIQKERKEIDDK